jgi:hypothetical protein
LEKDVSMIFSHKTPKKELACVCQWGEDCVPIYTVAAKKEIILKVFKINSSSDAEVWKTITG